VTAAARFADGPSLLFMLAVLWACAVPMMLSAWISFPLTQAEHYSAPIASDSSRRDAGALTLGVVLPLRLGWLTLHAGLHRVHHRTPATRWFHAPSALEADASSVPLSLRQFTKRWLAEGPRLWLPAEAPQADHA
jgi:fatty acid desaturase